MKRLTRKTVLICTLLLIVVISFARYGYLEFVLNREERALSSILAREPNRFQDVRVYRSKGNFNLMEGEVLRSEDVIFLQNEMRRLNIRRCSFAVRVRDVAEKPETKQ